MAILEAKNLIKKFGTFTAVDNLSFELQEGEILGSGCKTVGMNR